MNHAVKVSLESFTNFCTTCTSSDSAVTKQALHLYIVCEHFLDRLPYCGLSLWKEVRHSRVLASNSSIYLDKKVSYHVTFLLATFTLHIKQPLYLAPIYAGIPHINRVWIRISCTNTKCAGRTNKMKICSHYITPFPLITAAVRSRALHIMFQSAIYRAAAINN